MRTKAKTRVQTRSAQNNYSVSGLSYLALFMSTCSILLQIGLTVLARENGLTGSEKAISRQRRDLDPYYQRPTYRATEYVKEQINGAFERCHLRQKQKVVYHELYKLGEEKVINLTFQASLGFTILTADCSSMGSSEKYLVQPSDNNSKKYSCRCHGESNVKVPQHLGASHGKGANHRLTPIACVAHYWECPIDKVPKEGK